jgi:hypothetical protein
MEGVKNYPRLTLFDIPYKYIYRHFDLNIYAKIGRGAVPKSDSAQNLQVKRNKNEFKAFNICLEEEPL